jgi:hypothetical protein
MKPAASSTKWNRKNNPNVSDSAAIPYSDYLSRNSFAQEIRRKKIGELLLAMEIESANRNVT